MEPNTRITTGMEFRAGFSAQAETLNAPFGGALKAKPTHSLMIERQIPIIPPAPVKGAPLVGKQYRMARRKYGRRMRRGWPTETVRHYFGAATITAGPETAVDGGVSIELTIEQGER